MDDLDHEIYSTRMLIFLETSPQSNKYNQVYLNLDQFKKISDTISVVQRVEGEQEIVKLETSVETYELPDLKEINSFK